MARVVTETRLPDHHATFDDLKLAKIERVLDSLNLELLSETARVEILITQDELQVLEAALRLLTLYPRVRRVTT